MISSGLYVLGGGGDRQFVPPATDLPIIIGLPQRTPREPPLGDGVTGGGWWRAEALTEMGDDVEMVIESQDDGIVAAVFCDAGQRVAARGPGRFVKPHSLRATGPVRR